MFRSKHSNYLQVWYKGKRNYLKMGLFFFIFNTVDSKQINVR